MKLRRDRSVPKREITVMEVTKISKLTAMLNA